MWVSYTKTNMVHKLVEIKWKNATFKKMAKSFYWSQLPKLCKLMTYQILLASQYFGIQIRADFLFWTHYQQNYMNVCWQDRCWIFISSIINMKVLTQKTLNNLCCIKVEICTKEVQRLLIFLIWERFNFLNNFNNIDTSTWDQFFCLAKFEFIDFFVTLIQLGFFYFSFVKFEIRIFDLLRYLLKLNLFAADSSNFWIFFQYQESIIRQQFIQSFDFKEKIKLLFWCTTICCSRRNFWLKFYLKHNYAL